MNPDSKIKMSISDITREGDKLAITVSIGTGEITLFAFDEVREFPLRDLLIMLEREEER
jgi:tRNA threonylcarbamoyladenosine modification (KEOPS) complex Cgi121 subunit